MKLFERLIFNDLFYCFITNELFTNCQSGYLLRDSCISQLISIVHEINLSFDSSLGINVRGVFLDISKDFGKFLAPGSNIQIKIIQSQGKVS